MRSFLGRALPSVSVLRQHGLLASPTEGVAASRRTSCTEASHGRRAILGARGVFGAPRRHVPDFILGPPEREAGFSRPLYLLRHRLDQLPAPAPQADAADGDALKGFSSGVSGFIWRGPFARRFWYRTRILDVPDFIAVCEDTSDEKFVQFRVFQHDTTRYRCSVRARSAPGRPGAGSGAGSVSICIVSGHTQAKSLLKQKPAQHKAWRAISMKKGGSPGRTRTCNLAVNSRSLHH